MLDSRKALLAEGEKLQADLKKLVLSTRSSPFAQGATTLQSKPCWFRWRTGGSLPAAIGTM